MKPDDPVVRRYTETIAWRNRWTLLVYVIGVATVIFVVTTIALFITQALVPAGISTVASLISGGAAGWVEARRRDAVKEEESALGVLTASKEKEARDLADQTLEDELFGREGGRLKKS